MKKPDPGLVLIVVCEVVIFAAATGLLLYLERGP